MDKDFNQAPEQGLTLMLGCGDPLKEFFRNVRRAIEKGCCHFKIVMRKMKEKNTHTHKFRTKMVKKKSCFLFN